MEITERIIYLLQKHVLRELEAQELAELDAWANRHPAFQQLLEEVSDEKSLTAALSAFDQVYGGDPAASIARMEGRIADGIQAVSELQPASTRPLRLRKWLRYAAAVLIAVTAAAWIFYGNVMELAPKIVNLKTEDIAPGGNRATLTLADGRMINLEEEQTGIRIGDGITYLDGSSVIDEEPLVTDDEGSEKSLSTINYQLSTPKGGTYQLTLPDGSNVWLNAASTLIYPSRFEGNERVVELEGEGYFEVAKDSQRPFKVRSRGQEVEVMGTEFNVSTYPGEANARTTLVKGSVQIVNTQSNAINRLRPGEQAVVSGAAMDISKVSVEPYTAWKEGYFYFDNVPPEVAIEQVARWYDLEVVYEGNMPVTSVFGMVDRGKPLSAVLNSLAKSGLDFEIKRDGLKTQLIVWRN